MRFTLCIFCQVFRRNKLHLPDISPTLGSMGSQAGAVGEVATSPMQWSAVRMHGVGDDGASVGHSGQAVHIWRMGTTVDIIHSKTKPKKLVIYGTDGQQYHYLLKGQEDLHLDQRVMQLLRVVNLLLNGDDQVRVCARYFFLVAL